MRSDTTVTQAPSMVLSRAQTTESIVPTTTVTDSRDVISEVPETAPTQTMAKILTINALPPLAYTLNRRKIAILICWLLVFVDSVGLAICLYFPLVYATNLELWEGEFTD